MLLRVEMADTRRRNEVWDRWSMAARWISLMPNKIKPRPPTQRFGKSTHVHGRIAELARPNHPSRRNLLANPLLKANSGLSTPELGGIPLPAPNRVLPPTEIVHLQELPLHHYSARVPTPRVPCGLLDLVGGSQGEAQHPHMDREAQVQAQRAWIVYRRLMCLSWGLYTIVQLVPARTGQERIFLRAQRQDLVWIPQKSPSRRWSHILSETRLTNPLGPPRRQEKHKHFLRAYRYISPRTVGISKHGAIPCCPVGWDYQWTLA